MIFRFAQDNKDAAQRLPRAVILGEAEGRRDDNACDLFSCLPPRVLQSFFGTSFAFFYSIPSGLSS